MSLRGFPVQSERRTVVVEAPVTDYVASLPALADRGTGLTYCNNSPPRSDGNGEARGASRSA
jgi:hypothetical protein